MPNIITYCSGKREATINHIFLRNSLSKHETVRILKNLREKYTYSKPNDIAENILQREFFASAPKQK